MPIKMKALRSFGYGKVNEGAVSAGHEFTAHDEYRAKELEAHGLAYRIEARLPPRINPAMAQPVVENKASREGPLPSAGGRTGAVEPPPLSLQDQRPRRRRSRGSATDLLS